MRAIDKVVREMDRASYLDPAMEPITSKIEKCIIHRPYLHPPEWSEHIHLTMIHIAMLDVVLYPPPLIITAVNIKHGIFQS